MQGIVTYFLNAANAIQKFTATSQILGYTKAAGLGVVSNVLYFHNGTTATAVADASTAQTLTNKTLTAPVVNAPTGTDAREVVVTTNVIGAGESGTTFFLDLVGGFTSTLPAVAAGLNFKFIVKTAPTTAYIITTNAGANLIYGATIESAGTASAVAQAQDTANFVANVAVIGDWMSFESDGTNWYVTGFAAADGGITFAVT